MKPLFLALLTLALGVVLGLVFLNEPGYVLIGYGQWSVETSLSLLLFGLLLGFIVLYALLRLLAGARRTPRRLRAWRGRRRALRARHSLNQGLLSLSEGDWPRAERLLTQHADDSESPLLNYIAAARAAQYQGADARRDQYLRLAHQAMPNSDVAVGLTQADLQFSHQQMEQALATLTHLRSIAPRHAYVLKMLARLYQRLGDWERLRELLPELRKRRALPEPALDELEETVYRALLEGSVRQHDAAALQQLWGQLPRRLRQDNDLVLVYGRALHHLEQDPAAEPVLREAIRRQRDERLLDLYGRVRGENLGMQLSQLEEWLKEQPRNPVLLQAAGRLAILNRLWGKARSYLEAALEIQPTVEGYQLLGSLLEELEEPDEAAVCFRKGMQLATGETGRLPAPG
ncbi:heme biosynthesis protein HemY [Thiohalobacter sp. COW1]|uniref:heme biosynthesis HemY N-terminal domain-containing protein n=1 Tax=Thiohalobacter sp. COW1 TaxID=2795687 RepID=UPI0019159023|nr:heme biosynthesis HemY N-terminal domain-containing protein [Thiohalobacter sp. COW1]BCO32309.1 heme biosynthesis protein HemY [Thiohalobacter sp. COW1]